MANWQGPSHARSQRAEDLPGTGPRVAYFILLGNGRYALGVGDITESAAVAVESPIASAPGRLVLDDDITVAHRQPLLQGATRVLI